MKKIIVLFLTLTLLSCGSKKAAIHLTSAILTSECPKNGTCAVKVIPNKSMVVANDEFGNHYTLVDNFKTNVIQYQYSRTVKGNVQDSSYREEIVFEIGNDSPELTLSNAQIQNTKMLFGRFCYCKGQTGYYKVNSGTLALKQHLIALDFTIAEVPQIIKEVQLSIK